MKCDNGCGRYFLLNGTAHRATGRAGWDLVRMGISTEESAPCTFACPAGGAMRAPETENGKQKQQQHRQKLKLKPRAIGSSFSRFSFMSMVVVVGAFPKKLSSHGSWPTCCMAPARSRELGVAGHPGQSYQSRLLPGPQRQQ